MSQQPERDKSRSEPNNGQPPEDQRRGSRFGPGAWIASTLVQTMIALVGLVVVLFAVGRAFGVDFLGMLGDALTTHTGQWLAIASVALIVVVATLRAMRLRRSRW